VALDVGSAVLGIGKDVGDLLGPALQANPARERAAILGKGMLLEVGAVLLGQDAGEECQPVGGTFEQEDQRNIGSAEAPSAVHDRLKHGVEIRGGATKGGKHPARRRLLVPDFGKVATELLKLVA
jgi:hypothetical protein